MNNVTPKPPPVRNQAPLTARSVNLRCVSSAEYYSAKQYSITSKTKPQSISQEAIYYGTLANTFSRYQVFDCSGNRAKMLLKGHLGIKCHSQYNKVIRLLQYSSANS